MPTAFLRLAVDTGLIDRRGYWTGNDVRAPISADTAARTLRTSSAGRLLNRNPFERPSK